MSNFRYSQGKKLREALMKEKPLQVVGTINAYTALQAKRAGFHAIYLSGAGVANASHGLPDLGITTLNDVLEDVRRIMSAVDLPLLVDIDTGWGGAFSIARTIKEMIKAGAAAVHIEDQVQAKRCGHRPGKALVEKEEMIDRIKAAVDAKTDPDFVIMARTDSLANEGLNKALERISAYIEAGADMIFFEGVRKLEEYQALTEQCNVPVLANITEFGVTPLFTLEELKEVGVSLALYPLSAFRAMSAAAEKVYDTIRKNGSQNNILAEMQTREELYQVLNYHFYEDKLNELFMKEKTT
ncbi:TPA: methylisocitrate lyase [Legionella pneumophila]|uniref:2-methylisocitrate lyase n=1 Tax=Legionella pneumophila (strain Lens) TaxID=297245 RepID=Q5X0G7_LEGPL|nr:methylisocitrate lyase [Legionella pneumophila]AOW53209.1 methylisocitrate lyase [Legionella pneumophila subsp. pneumophila]AOW55891.1 methylisocitrate lyase [Legionella pneumophila subsp. pneumophila]AOW58545.1 methylisocitrate lyase [Legionella pneumophila subsp. pneumophila]AOW61269.1 methylisocitrate lyase [Legionella pneumophila subsp. pneumophila]AOW64007.1 methylisocitrate lyase [Legionella pneumophila subsp. pneumophila]